MGIVHQSMFGDFWGIHCLQDQLSLFALAMNRSKIVTPRLFLKGPKKEHSTPVNVYITMENHIFFYG